MSNREVHYRYAISYLVLAIVLVIALKYYDVPDLVDKFSFALTLSSLLLAVLAIFFTVISSQKQDLQLTKLIETNTNISAATHDIRRAANEISHLSKETPRQFHTLSSKLDDLSSSFESLPHQELSNLEDDEGELIKVEISEHQFTAMFVSFHYEGMWTLYLFQKSLLKDKNIPAAAFTELDIGTFFYATGFLSVLSSLNLLEFKIHNEEVLPVSCSTIISDHIDELMNSVMEVIKSPQLEVFQERFEAVNRYVS